MADDFNDSLVYITRLLEGIMDNGVSIDPVSTSAYTKLLENFSAQVGKIGDTSRMTKDELKATIGYFKTFVASYELKSTEFNKQIMQLQRSLEGRIGAGESLETEKLLKGLSNMFTSALLQSMKAEQRGDKNGIFKKVLDNDKLSGIFKDLAERMGVKLEGVTDKLMSFFKDENKQKDKKNKSLIGDLIDGLEKSKFVGGALRDTFALVGLLGANWLTQFGQFGRILGGAFYVAMTTAGPLLINGLLKGMASIFTGSLRFFGNMLGGIGKGVWGAALNASMKAGGPLAEFVTAGTGTQKAVAAGKMAPSLLYGAGAIWAGKEATDSWKKGNKGQAGVFGLGAGGLGVAAIAALIAGPLAPVAVIAAAVGGIAVAVGAIWKNWDKIERHYKENQVFYDKVLDFFSLFSPIVGWIRNIIDSLPGHGGNEERQNRADVSAQFWHGSNKKGYISSQLLEGKHKIPGVNRHLDPKKMTAEDWARADKEQPVYGPMGQILNLGRMTQRRASEVIKADIQQKGSNSYYEIAPAGLTRQGAFRTDAFDKETGGALVARGTVDALMKMRRHWSSKGYDVSNVLLQGGIGTLGTQGVAMSPHTYTSGLASHFGSSGTVIDIGLPKYKGKTIGLNEFQQGIVNSGFAPGGTPLIEDRGGSNEHGHIPLGILPTQQKAIAQRHSLEVQGVISNLEKEAYDKINEEHKGETNEKLLKLYEQELKNRGYKQDTNTGDWVQKNGTRYQVDVSGIDPTGNTDYQKTQFVVSKVVNFGS